MNCSSFNFEKTLGFSSRDTKQEEETKPINTDRLEENHKACTFALQRNSAAWTHNGSHDLTVRDSRESWREGLGAGKKRCSCGCAPPFGKGPCMEQLIWENELEPIWGLLPGLHQNSWLYLLSALLQLSLFIFYTGQSWRPWRGRGKGIGGLHRDAAHSDEI